MNYEDKLMQYGFRFSYNSATLYILLNTTDNWQGIHQKEGFQKPQITFDFLQKGWLNYWFSIDKSAHKL